MDYDVIPIGHSLAFHFHGHNMRPSLDAQLAPFYDKLTPYYKSFVGLSDTSSIAAVLDSIEFTTRRAAAPSPIATRTSQIPHATSTTFALPAEAVEAPKTSASQIAQETIESHGFSTPGNILFIASLFYIAVLVAFIAGLMAFNRPDGQPLPDVAIPESTLDDEDLSPTIPVLPEEAAITIEKEQFTVDETTYNLLLARVQELELIAREKEDLEVRVDQLEAVEEELQARVDDLEDAEEELEGTIDSLQTKATQAGQEAAWRKEKQKLQDEKSTVQKDVDKKNATIQRQQKDHRRKEEDWRQEENSLQFRIKELEEEPGKNAELSAKHLELETEFEDTEKKNAKLERDLSAAQAAFRGQSAGHTSKLELMEKTQQETDDRHQQELAAARQTTEMERAKATNAEQECQSVSQANQELRTSYEGKVIEITNLTKQVDTLKHDLGDCQLQIQERDSRIVEKQNIINSFGDTNDRLMSLHQDFEEINKEHSQCNMKLGQRTKQCEILGDQVQDLRSFIDQEKSVETGSQKSELEDHDSQTTEEISTPKPAASLASSTWATQVSTEASSLSEQEQYPPTVTAVTVEPMSDTARSAGKPTINLPVAPSHAPKGPSVDRNRDDQHSYKKHVRPPVDNHYKFKDYYAKKEPNRSATSSDTRSQLPEQHQQHYDSPSYRGRSGRDSGHPNSSRGGGYSSGERDSYRSHDREGHKGNYRGGYRGGRGGYRGDRGGY